MEKEITIENLQQEVAQLKAENESLKKQLAEAKSDYERASNVFMLSDGELRKLKAQVYTVREILKNLKLEP